MFGEDIENKDQDICDFTFYMKQNHKSDLIFSNCPLSSLFTENYIKLRMKEHCLWYGIQIQMSLLSGLRWRVSQDQASYWFQWHAELCHKIFWMIPTLQYINTVHYTNNAFKRQIYPQSTEGWFKVILYCVKTNSVFIVNLNVTSTVCGTHLF